jgi:hypothetical protein
MTLRTISCLLALGGLAAVGPAVAGEPAPLCSPSSPSTRFATRR